MTPLVMSKPNFLVTTKKTMVSGPSIRPVQIPKYIANMDIEPTLEMITKIKSIETILTLKMADVT